MPGATGAQGPRHVHASVMSILASAHVPVLPPPKVCTAPLRLMQQRRTRFFSPSQTHRWRPGYPLGPENKSVSQFAIGCFQSVAGDGPRSAGVPGFLLCLQTRLCRNRSESNLHFSIFVKPGNRRSIDASLSNTTEEDASSSLPASPSHQRLHHTLFLQRFQNCFHEPLHPFSLQPSSFITH